MLERLLKKRKQEFDTVDQVNLVEENKRFEIEYGKEDLVEENRGPFWNDLPLELFSKVAEYLTHSQIVSLAATCTYFYCHLTFLMIYTGLGLSASRLLQMDGLWKRFFLEYQWKLDDHIQEQAQFKNGLQVDQDSDRFWRSKYKQTHVREWMKERTKTPVRTYSKRFQIISPSKPRTLSRSTSDLRQQ